MFLHLLQKIAVDSQTQMYNSAIKKKNKINTLAQSKFNFNRVMC